MTVSYRVPSQLKMSYVLESVTNENQFGLNIARQKKTTQSVGFLLPAVNSAIPTVGLKAFINIMYMGSSPHNRVVYTSNC